MMTSLTPIEDVSVPARGKNMSSNLPTELVLELSGHQGPVRAVRFNRKGSYCLTCGSDKTLMLWNPHKGLRIKTYMGHGAEVLDADASHDNGRLVSGGADKVVILTDVGTGQPIRKFRGHMSRINSVKFNEDSSLVFSASYDSYVRVWDCRSRTYTAVQVMDEAKDSVTSLQLSNHEILTGSVDGRVRRYDIRFGRLCTDTIGVPVTSVNFSRDGNCVLLSSLDDTLRLLDKETGEMLNSYKGHSNCDYKIDSCLTHDDAHVISGSEDGKIYFWDLVEGNLVHSVQQPSASSSSSSSSSSSKCVVYSLAHHHKEACLLSAGSRGSVAVWKPPGWDKEEDGDGDDDDDDDDDEMADKWMSGSDGRKK